jgi:hypothetical protein
MPVNLLQQRLALLFGQLDDLSIYPLESLHRSVRIMRMFLQFLIDLSFQTRRWRIVTDDRLLLQVLRDCRCLCCVRHFNLPAYLM